MDKDFWESRAKVRALLSPEERRLEALEDIADSLCELVEAVRSLQP
jgi:hypothetical protein